MLAQVAACCLLAACLLAADPASANHFDALPPRTPQPPQSRVYHYSPRPPRPPRAPRPPRPPRPEVTRISPPAVFVIEANGMSAIQTLQLAMDDGFAPINLPFEFNFFCDAHTSVTAATNGLLLLGGVDQGSGATSYMNQEVPSPALPNNLIAAFWDDLVTASGGADASVLAMMMRQVNSQDRALGVQWTDMESPYADPIGTFQAWLFEGSNAIVLRYVTLGNNPWALGASATVGIENKDGSAGNQFSHDTEALRAGMCLRFTPQPADCAAAYEMTVMDSCPDLPVLSSGIPDGVIKTNQGSTFFRDGSIQAPDSEGSLRLTASQISGHMHYGLLQVLYAGEWVPACYDAFSPEAAVVACTQLGFTSGFAGVQNQALSASSQALIAANCRGEEAEILACPDVQWGAGACSADAVVTLYCTR